ncbi:MAG: immunity 17 family protein [Firmicutes bacterium]|nr:immunity 17 family protein [Bacillota bacterium]
MTAGIFAVLAGVWCIAASYLDLDIFFESSKANFFVNLFGREGARTFYGVLGGIILVLGILMCFTR